MNRTDLLLGCGVFCTPLSSEKKYTGCPGNAHLRAAHFSPALTDGIIATTPVGQGIWSEISLAHCATRLSHCNYHSVTHGVKNSFPFMMQFCNEKRKQRGSSELFQSKLFFRFWTHALSFFSLFSTFACSESSRRNLEWTCLSSWSIWPTTTTASLPTSSVSEFTASAFQYR